MAATFALHGGWRTS
ncbi:trp operon leader peptide [Salmonella enterica]|nr:trp operon leader peptide [Salmonella enterica]EJU7756148.1 trp operon leader peptide [Salmonella enterica subsp. enterica serovar 11:b:1,7]EHK4159258.1 trp operon leader peptide [Salmonella enterica]EHM6379885.1 trp operon leader peptide [Salmonella enterica]EHN6199974.1 trp operon leader peptide [Salmonella enterica]EHP3620289.1 trp operon leader peptide [Salmonella enterica]